MAGLTEPRPSSSSSPPPSSRGWLRRNVFTTDHKAVARMYLWFGLAYLLLGGIMAMNLRWSLTYPGRPTPFLGSALYARTGAVVSPPEYLSLMTLHGTVMVFFAISPLLLGWLGNQVVPLMIGARRTAFPALGALSFWLTLAGGVVLVASLYVPRGGPIAGWTSYPTLSSRVGSPGPGQDYWCAAILLVTAASVMSALNLVTTVVRLRAPGMGFFRLPLTAWGVTLASALTVLFGPVLFAGTLLLLLDRNAGTRFFLAGMASGEGPAGDPLLYQHLFWLFGHPEVYILILPVWGAVSDLLAVFARKPAYGYRSTVLAFASVAVLSGLVYGHHLFVAGISPRLAEAFMTLTVLVSVPSGVFFVNWLATLRHGAIRFEPPMLYALGVLVVFAVGGTSGLFLGAITTDVYLHDTFFVVGHFHLVMAAALMLGFFAAVHYWFPKAFGRMLHPGLARAHFALTLLLVCAVFGGMLVMGWSGMLRRTYDPVAHPYAARLAGTNRGVSHAAFSLGAVQLLFVANVVWSLFRGERAGANPWGAATLEWATSSPPPRENFEHELVVHNGPHEYAHPRAPAGRDYVMQHERVDEPAGGGEGSAAS